MCRPADPVVCTHNSRKTTDPLDIVFRIEETVEEHKVHLDRDVLNDVFDGRTAVERFSARSKRMIDVSTFGYRAADGLETHVYLVLIDCLLITLANRLDDLSTNLKDEAMVITEQSYNVFIVMVNNKQSQLAGLSRCQTVSRGMPQKYSYTGH